MEKKIFETKRNDYIDLCASFSELLEKYKDYTPESATELEETITRACANSADIPGANKLFRLLKGYIQHRYNELEEYRKRREASEKEFFGALPQLCEQIIVDDADGDSCTIISDAVDKYCPPVNYQLLVKAFISALSTL